MWITSNDYPPIALQNKMSGTVEFELGVDVNGRVTNCRVTKSSGFKILDVTTCDLMMQRARFKPTLNRDGPPMRRVYRNKVTWKIPE